MDNLVDINDIVKMTGVQRQQIYNWILRKSKFLLSLDPFPTPINQGTSKYKNLWYEEEVRDWLEKTNIIQLDPNVIVTNRVFVIPHYPVLESNLKCI